MFDTEDLRTCSVELFIFFVFRQFSFLSISLKSIPDCSSFFGGPGCLFPTRLPLVVRNVCRHVIGTRTKVTIKLRPEDVTLPLHSLAVSTTAMHSLFPFLAENLDTKDKIDNAVSANPTLE